MNPTEASPSKYAGRHAEIALSAEDISAMIRVIEVKRYLIQIMDSPRFCRMRAMTTIQKAGTFLNQKT
jgi:hypothetical protein